jgi:inorganic pyrophosphatase
VIRSSNAYHEASELPQHRSLVLRRFFQDNKHLEEEAVEVEEIVSVSAAYAVIEDALHRYSEYRRRGFKS